MTDNSNAAQDNQSEEIRAKVRDVFTQIDDNARPMQELAYPELGGAA